MERYVPVTSGTIYRVYSTRGLYWKKSFRTNTAYFGVADEFLWSACHFDESSHKGDFYTEFDQILLEEVRLLSAIALSIDQEDQGVVCYYPYAFNTRLSERVALDETLPDSVKKKLLAHNHFGNSNQPHWSKDSPPNLSQYHLKEAPEPLVDFEQLFLSIDTQNYTLMRGLAALLRASMLSTHELFMEDALHCLYVSLDASFSLVIDTLRLRGVDNPSSQDAQRFIEELFDEETTGFKYFQDYYEDRIIAFHPKSRFGSFPYNPTMNDDYYFLSYQLMSVFRELIMLNQD